MLLYVRQKPPVHVLHHCSAVPTKSVLEFIISSLELMHILACSNGNLLGEKIAGEAGSNVNVGLNLMN